MPKCPNCHGAGFTLHQVAWSMGRVRIFCKTCDGIGYTYKKVMTPLQRKQLAQILLKEGEENWRVEAAQVCLDGSRNSWGLMKPDHYIYAIGWRYRAVRIERVPTRTPLPIEHYKRGMEIANGPCICLVSEKSGSNTVRVLYPDETLEDLLISAITLWRWPNETEWKPAFTETVEERVVETLIVEGL